MPIVAREEITGVDGCGIAAVEGGNAELRRNEGGAVVTIQAAIAATKMLATGINATPMSGPARTISRKDVMTAVAPHV